MQHYGSLFQLHASGLVKAPQVVLLAALTPDRSGVPFGDVVHRTGLSPSHTSTALDGLVKSRLAEKRYPLRDGRTITVYLTPAGAEKAFGMLAALNQKVATAEQTAEK